MSFLDLAVRQASRSACRYRVGAVLAVGRRVLATASNQQRNLPTVDFKHATFHAEEMVLRRTRYAVGAVVYVARINRAENPMMAAPCLRCQAALRKAGVVKAIYTTPLGAVSLDFSSGENRLLTTEHDASSVPLIL